MDAVGQVVLGQVRAAFAFHVSPRANRLDIASAAVIAQRPCKVLRSSLFFFCFCRCLPLCAERHAQHENARANECLLVVFVARVTLQVRRRGGSAATTGGGSGSG